VIRNIAARRYAEAAYELARQREAEDEWSTALKVMAQTFSEPQMAAAMASARLAPTDKHRLAKRVLEGIDPLALNLALLLVAKGRTALAPQITEAFQALADEAQGIAHAVVTTAVPLSREEEQAIAAKLREATGKQVVLESQVDEGIIGGLVARIGDLLIDGSTKSQLLALKRRLQEARA
jgi:F-type H+-transporting ATPase subunit delta